MSGLFSSVEFGASLFDRAEMFNRRDEHLWIAKSALEVSKLGRFLEGNSQVSRAASIPTWKGPIDLRRIGETLCVRCPVYFDLLGSHEEVFGFVNLSWEDKLIVCSRCGHYVHAKQF